jgi:hypothetical protein
MSRNDLAVPNVLGVAAFDPFNCSSQLLGLSANNASFDPNAGLVTRRRDELKRGATLL